MFSYQKKIPIGELTVGMYVFQLDRSWSGTPFPLQGFHIKDEDDIRMLGQYCKHVIIDITRSDIRKTNEYDRDAAQSKPIVRGRYHNTLELKPFIYEASTPLNEEIKKARTIYKDVKESIDKVTHHLLTNSDIDFQQTVKASENIVKSVLKNPDAMLWVMKLKHQTNDIYQHAINCSIWAAVLGKEIGLKESRIQNLVTGVMLSKIGLTMLQEEMADTPFYEFQVTAPYFRHIDYAINLLATQKKLPAQAIEAIVNHEERYDGSGFPNELEGDQIPLFAQIAGLIDTYESMLNPMFREVPLSPSEAVSELYAMRGHEFDNKLIETFIQVLGLFPPGSLVELSTSELAIVTHSERKNRLQPNVLVVTDMEKRLKKKATSLDIQTFNSNQVAKGGTHKIEILRSFPIGSYDIWPHQFKYQQDSVLEKLFG